VRGIAERCLQNLFAGEELPVFSSNCKIQTCLNLNCMVGIAAGMTVDSMQDAALEENNEEGAMA
jgi:hypothetical protein